MYRPDPCLQVVRKVLSLFPNRESNREPFNFKSRGVPVRKPSQPVSRQLFCMWHFMFSWRWLWRVTILWYVTPCSTVEVYWRFGGTCCFHLQCRRVSQAFLKLNLLSRTFVLIFEVFTAVNINVMVFCDVTPCSLVDMCHCFIWAVAVVKEIFRTQEGFYREEGGSSFILNISDDLPRYTESHLIRQYSAISCSLRR
jgi:hypothetical protein